MKFLSHTLALVLGIAAVPLLNVVAAPLNLPYDKELNLVRHYCDLGDHTTLQQLGESLLEGPSAYTDEEKGELIAEVCASLASTKFEGFRGRPVADAIALPYLSSNPPVEPWVKVRLITSLGVPPVPSVDVAKWTQGRKQRAAVMIDLWGQLETDLKGFDPKKMDFVRYVPTPRGISVAAGVDPSLIARAITDPAQRQTYLNQVEENQTKQAIYSKKFEEQHALDLLSQIVGPFLTSAYSKPPYDLVELKQLLEPIGAKNPIKQKILTSVTAEMNLKLEGVDKDPFAPTKATE